MPATAVPVIDVYLHADDTRRALAADVRAGLLAKPKDLRDFGHDGKLRTVAVEQIKHAIGGLNHQLKRAAIAVAMDFVIEGEDELQHSVPWLTQMRLYGGRR